MLRGRGTGTEYRCWASTWLRRLVAVALIAGLGGCVIGTWPTPEERTKTASSGSCTSCGGQQVGSEACDGIDNNGNGTIDEGCPCTSGDQRGCIGVAADQCGLGVQQCVQGLWQGCVDVGPPYRPLQTASVGTITTTPAALVRDDIAGLTVTVAPQPACPWIQIAQADVVLEAADPTMRVRATARDDGQGDDAVAGDGVLTAHLSNPFGPGVAAQDLTLTVGVVLDGQSMSAQRTVPLEDP